MIPKGTRTYIQDFYVWPESEADHENGWRDDGNTTSEAEAAGVASARSASKASAGAWRNLPPHMKWMFRIRGLGGKRGIRSEAMAERLYETIPLTIRNQGPSAVRDFLRGRSASHIKSVANAPSRAKQPSNIVWEPFKKNVTRGSRNMTGAEVASTKSAMRISAVKATAKGAAKGGVAAALVEGPIAGVENVFHWKRGRKSGEQATKDAAKSTATAAGVGTVATAGLAFVPLGPLAVPIAIGGLLIGAGSAIHRIYKAARHDVPLDQFRVFFCKNRGCRTEYAETLVDASRG